MANASEEPTTAAGMMEAIAKVSDGTNVIGESMKTFSMTEGTNKKGDVTIRASDMPGALAALKTQIEHAKTKAKGRKLEMWEFKASPHAQMGKTLDDTFKAFLMWARLGSKDDDDDDVGEVGVINVSKAFRRVESYADWMEDSKSDLLAGPMNYNVCKVGVALWGMACSYDASGRLVWWVDLGKLDRDKLKTYPVEDSLRMFVWFAHVVMYDPKAQENGMCFAEILGTKLGFWSMMTLFPMKLSVKLDRLTIGVLPVKMKMLVILDTPGWMSILMKIFGVFISKKMKSRMKVTTPLHFE